MATGECDAPCNDFDAQLQPSTDIEKPAAATEDVSRTQLPDWVEQLSELTSTVDVIRREMAVHHERAAARERVIDRLHEENQKLRAGERQILLRPYLIDLQRLRNDLLRQSGSLPDEMPGARIGELLASFAQSVELTLERGGVVVLRPTPGEPFDPSTQRAVEVVSTSVAGQDSMVAEVLADGYQDTVSNRILMPTSVKVFRLAATASDGHSTTAAVDSADAQS